MGNVAFLSVHSGKNWERIISLPSWTPRLPACKPGRPGVLLSIPHHSDLTLVRVASTSEDACDALDNVKSGSSFKLG